MTDSGEARQSGITQTSQWSQPRIVATRLGPVEYSEYGQGPVVVSLHGAMGGHDQSRILAQTIAGEGYRHLAISRPGYLGTPLSSGKSPESQADLIAALLEELGIETASVMAVSGGGPAAIFFAHRFPHRCRSLVLASTCATKISTPIPLSFKVMQVLARIPFVADSIGKKMSADLQTVAGRSITDPDLLEQTFADPQVAPLFKAMLLSTAGRMNRRLAGTKNDIRISRSYDYPLEALKMAVLIVHGELDQHVPFLDHALPLQRRLPQSKLLAIDQGEHVAIFTHRKEVQAAVMEFLKSTTSPDQE